MDFRRQMNDFFAQIYRQNELYDIWAKQNRMKPSTVAVLYLLDQFETCTQSWISKIYLLPKQTIHTVVQELEQFAAMVEMTRKFTDSFEKEIRNGAE